MIAQSGKPCTPTIHANHSAIRIHIHPVSFRNTVELKNIMNALCPRECADETLPAMREH